ncbi:MAG TPA: GNAT family N-acetyltransferase [Pyrinomonadaceae bacterium]|nr:GNAT family N-acetyltransferase [Pyrinomonadaceae bacterium]
MSVASFIDRVMAESAYLPEPGLAAAVSELTERDRAEVLALLAERPVNTVGMAGLIRDNGVVSPHHRGTFYGCRNSEGRLEGVALIGHHTLVEARTRRALAEFALIAQACARTHMIMGEVETVDEFWKAYADEGRAVRRVCREVLFELRRPALAGLTQLMVEPGAGLRRAAAADVDLIAPVHAALAEAESGVNPLDTDPQGFVRRCLRRINQGRTWVVVEGGRLVFKADVQADTLEVVYLEGVYVHPDERGTALGRRYMNQLCRRLLARTHVLCLLANEENERAQRFYRVCGFRARAVYDTLYLRRD